jgi:hypothetical protein
MAEGFSGTNIPNDTMILTVQLNNKLFDKDSQKRGRSIEINTFSVLKDDIKNYRPLTEFQLMGIEYLSENEKIEIIKLYNTMIISLQDIL